MSHAAHPTEAPKKELRVPRGGQNGNLGRAGKIFTLELQEQFLKKYRKDRSVERAARAVGFRETTIYRQMARSKRFHEQVDKARMEHISALEFKLLGFAHGDEFPVHNAQITAIFGCLRAFKPERYRENMKVSVGAEGDFATLIQGMSLALNVAAQQKVEQTKNANALEHDSGGTAKPE